MKFKKYFLVMLGAGVLASCNDIDDQLPQSGTLTASQVQETNEAIPSRVDATFSGMFTMMGVPGACYGSTRADDFGFISAAISQDAEGADFIMADNDYNWFSAACELSTRNANYANPYMRYTMPYRQIGVAQEIINSFPEDTEDQTAIYEIAQAKAVRAFDYMALAPYFQFSYLTAADQPCVPMLNEGVDYTNNPRATVAEVYAQVMEDLNYAVENLAGYDRGTDKTKIDQKVAYGLRARANLAMGNWAAAAADAEAAMQGYTPASIVEVSVPAFCNINEHNWMWGIDITDDQVSSNGFPTSSSWVSAFSGDGYAAACGCTPRINTLLWKEIPATDVRKGWWLDENLHSDNIASLVWVADGVSYVGDEICTLVTSDGSKIEYDPYTNVKFGMQSGVGSTLNNNDWPLMRVEEMILIAAEGYARSGNESKAKSILTDFVQTYRNPQYSISTGRELVDEIWLQRRIELWGEGFFTSDAKRMSKNIVRFQSSVTSNVPDAFKFNIASTDGWLNMRFPQSEMDNNLGIVDNEGGAQPESGQNPSLRDGVTD